MSTPILLIIFNRPKETRRTFEAIKESRPQKLFIAADGPRQNRPEEAEFCREVREIVENIDWPCEVQRNYSKKNRGCRKAVSEAITWFFENVEEGIILEDDCIPDPSFFPYCTELLERYRDNERVMHIGGTTFLNKEEIPSTENSYHFSHVAHVWGWATWKRAWQKYDIEMTKLDGFEHSQTLSDAFPAQSHRKFWVRLFRHVRDKRIDTWDAQWAYTILSSSGMAVMPHSNLIENIGFDKNATHTQSSNINALPVTPLTFPLAHPRGVVVDNDLDSQLMDKIYIKSIWNRAFGIIHRLLK